MICPSERTIILHTKIIVSKDSKGRYEKHKQRATMTIQQPRTQSTQPLVNKGKFQPGKPR